jgi:hypothetical protein
LCTTSSFHWNYHIIIISSSSASLVSVIHILCIVATSMCYITIYILPYTSLSAFCCFINILHFYNHHFIILHRYHIIGISISILSSVCCIVYIISAIGYCFLLFTVFIIIYIFHHIYMFHSL